MRTRRREWFVPRRISGSFVLLSPVSASWWLLCFFFVVTCRYDELRDLIRVVKNSQKIKDVAKVQSGRYMIYSFKSVSILTCSNLPV